MAYRFRWNWRQPFGAWRQWRRVRRAWIQQAYSRPWSLQLPWQQENDIIGREQWSVERSRTAERDDTQATRRAAEVTAQEEVTIEAVRDTTSVEAEQLSTPTEEPVTAEEDREAGEIPRPVAAQDRRAILFAIFDEIVGHEEEFLADGRPRVDSVNDRLPEGDQPRASRDEIDMTFADWQQSRANNSS